MTVCRFARITLVGKLIGSWAGEIWQTGIHCVDGDSGGVFAGGIRQSLPTFDATAIGEAEQTTDFAIEWAWEGDTKFTKANQIALATAAKSYFSQLGSGILSDTQLTEVRIAALYSKTSSDVGPWSYLNGANVFTLANPLVGSGSTTGGLPPQCNLVVSLTTGARGARGRGRMYVPIRGASGANCRPIASTVTSLGTNTRTFLKAIRTVGPLPAVVNQSIGTYSGITGLEVGNAFDVQRRRVNRVSETYSAWPAEIV